MMKQGFTSQRRSCRITEAKLELESFLDQQWVWAELSSTEPLFLEVADAQQLLDSQPAVSQAL